MDTDFNLQTYLADMRREQKQDHDSLALTVAAGFAEVTKVTSDHHTRLVVQENFRRSTRWVTGTLLTCLVLPLIVYGITLYWR